GGRPRGSFRRLRSRRIRRLFPGSGKRRVGRGGRRRLQGQAHFLRHRFPAEPVFAQGGLDQDVSDQEQPGQGGNASGQEPHRPTAVPFGNRRQGYGFVFAGNPRDGPVSPQGSPVAFHASRT